MRISVPCWKECKTVLLWETAWQVLRKSNIELPHDPAIPFLGICTKELKAVTQRDTCEPSSWQHY